MTKSEAPELLPCPFCGNAAFVREDSEHSTAFVLEHFSKGCPIDDLWDWYPDRQQAVTVWNARPEETRLKQGITLIERAYYMEGKDKESRASTMNSIARDLQDGKDLAWARRLFSRREAL